MDSETSVKETFRDLGASSMMIARNVLTRKRFSADLGSSSWTNVWQILDPYSTGPAHHAHPTAMPLNYAAFSHCNFAVETFSKPVLTIQDSASAVSANTSRHKCLECLSSPFPYSCQTICKTRAIFINRTCIKLSHIFSTATFNS